MKNWIKILAVICPIFLLGQKNIEATQHLFVSINFPANIEHYKVSMPDILDVQTQQDNLYLQYLVEEVDKPINILVKTFDGYYYSLLVNYSNSPKVLNYFFTPQESLHKITPSATQSISINNPTNVTKNTIPVQNSLPMLTNKGLSDFDIVAQEVLKKGGYIKSRNITINKKVELIHRGIYFENKNSYFLFELNNNSNIPFEVENYLFEIITLENDKSSLQARSIAPTHIYNKLKRIEAKTKNKLVFVLEPFTISDNKKLRVTIVERGGERTLVYEVSPKTLSETQILNNK